MKRSFLFWVAALSSCAVDETPDLETVTSALEASDWTPNVQIPNQSTAKQVGLASFGGRIYMVHTGSSDANNLYQSRWNGSSWSDDVLVPDQHADGGPAMTVFSNRPTMIYRVAGENRLAMSTWYSNAWTAPVTVGRGLGSSQIRSAPSVVVHVDGGIPRLFIAYCATMSGRDHVFLDAYVGGGAWSSRGQLDLEGYTCKHPTVYSAGTNLKILFNRYLGSIWYDDQWFLSEVTVDPGLASGSIRWFDDHFPLDMITKKPMSVVRCGIHRHLTHGGGDDYADAIYWTTSGSTGWQPDQRVPNQASNGGATMVCHDSRLFMVHNGGTNQLYMSELVE